MTYQDQTGDLSEQVQTQVIAALGAYLAGQLTAETLAAVVAAFLAAGNTGAAALGDLALAAAVTLSTGTPAAPLGLTRPTDEPDRLTRAADTILGDLKTQDPDRRDASLDYAEMRFRRLVESEIRKSVSDAYAEAIAVSPTVTGWVRGLEPDACELCTWWWREGRVWPADHPFQHHQGCDCSQQIVTVTPDQIRPTNTRKRRAA